MLVVSGTAGDEIVLTMPGRNAVAERIRVTITKVAGKKVSIGIAAPSDVTIHRKVVQDAIDAGKAVATVEPITDRQYAVLVETIGMNVNNYCNSPEWWENNIDYRNSYTTTGSTNGDLEELDSEGFMIRGATFSDGSIDYHPTNAGLRYAHERFTRERKAVAK